MEINSVNVKIEQKRFSYTFPLKLGDNKIYIIYKNKGKTEIKDFLVKRITKEELENEITQNYCEMDLASSVKVEKTNWSKGDRGYVAEHNVLIFNPCKFKIKDIEFKANYYSNSSTQIGSTSHTVYEVINPNSRKWLKFSGLVHPQASSSSVTISSVKKIE